MKVLNPEAAARIEELEKEIAKIKHDSLSDCQKRSVDIEDMFIVYRKLKVDYDDNQPLCVLVDEAPDTHNSLVEKGIKGGLDRVLAMLFEELRENMHN